MVEMLREKLAAEDFIKVVCAGDIQTIQPFTAPKWTDWVLRALRENGDLTKTWRRQLVNVGMRKATLQHISTFYSHYISSCKPDLAIISFGVSSIFPQFSEQEYLLGLDTLISKLKADNISFVLWSPYPLAGGHGKEEFMKISTIMKEKAETNGGLFVDVLHAFEGISLGQLFTHNAIEDDDIMGLKKDSPDHININAIGSYIIAKELSEAIFGLPLPTKSIGDYEVPNVSAFKSW